MPQKLRLETREEVDALIREVSGLPGPFTDHGRASFFAGAAANHLDKAMLSINNAQELFDSDDLNTVEELLADSAALLEGFAGVHVGLA